MANHISTIMPHLQDIECPALLKNLQGWLVWRFESHDGEAKPRKVPYYPTGGRRHGAQGSLDDRAKLTTFAAAKAAAARKGFDGVGLALMPEFNITALDFDNCVTPYGILPEVEQVILGTYSEYSPSGTGVRAFVIGGLGNRKSLGDDQPFGFETFSSKGFVTLTGNITEVCSMFGLEDTVAPSSLDVHLLIEQRFSRGLPNDDLPAPGDLEPLGLTEEELTQALDHLDADLSRPEWLQVGMALHSETRGDGFDLWDEWSSAGHKYPGREELEKQWSSFDRPRTGATVTARTLIKMANAAGAGVRVPDLAAPSADDFDDISSNDDPLPRFTFQQAADFTSGKPATWIVKNILPKAEVAMVYGAPGSGKTFWVLDLVLAIAREMPDWGGRKIKGGAVAYIAAEGAGGVKTRLKAYAQQHDLDLKDIPLYLMGTAPNLLESKDAKAVLAAAKAIPEEVVVIVGDTYASMMPGGNENSGEDAGRVVANCKAFSRATGALFILIHHSGKDASKGARGWSGMLGAVDAEIEIIRNGAVRMARITKLKDGADASSEQEFGFELTTVQLNERDEDGDIITSCVVTPRGDFTLEMAQDKKGKKGANALALTRALAMKVMTASVGITGVVTAGEVAQELSVAAEISLTAADAVLKGMHDDGLIRYSNNEAAFLPPLD